MEAYELDLDVVCWFSYYTDDRCLLAMGYQSASATALRCLQALKFRVRLYLLGDGLFTNQRGSGTNVLLDYIDKPGYILPFATSIECATQSISKLALRLFKAFKESSFPNTLSNLSP